MNKLLKYPSRYELIEVLFSITNKSFLNTFAQEKGIFITNSNHEQLAEEISKLFLDNEDLERIRLEAYHQNTNHTLSGFVVSSTEANFNLKNLYQWIFEEGERKTGQKLSAPVKVSPDKEIYRASVEYNRKKAGRIEFLQDEVSSFEFYMEKVSDNDWKVQVDCNRSTDTKELHDLLNQAFIKEYHSFTTIDQKLLTTELSIDFFDRLSTEGMDSKWRLDDIKHLTLKQGDVNDSDLEGTEVPEKELAGITQAILEGKNLRENTFVKQSVSSGYRFNAMTYEFHHITEPYIVQIKAEFKGRPKVFEISIVGYEQKIGSGAVREGLSLSKNEDLYIRSAFWNNAKSVFDDVINRKNLVNKV